MGRSCIKRYTIRGTVTSPPPTKIIAVHLNYRSRAEQRGWVPDVPSYFMKPVSSIARNGDAVMELLRDLHRNGSTICMVTHDPRFARHADRTVHLFDGRVVDENVEAAAGAMV